MAETYDEAVADYEAARLVAKWNAECDAADVARGRTIRKGFYDVGRVEALAWIAQHQGEDL